MTTPENPAPSGPDQIRADRIQSESEAQRAIAQSNRVKAELEQQRFGTGDQG